MENNKNDEDDQKEKQKDKRKSTTKTSPFVGKRKQVAPNKKNEKSMSNSANIYNKQTKGHIIINQNGSKNMNMTKDCFTALMVMTLIYNPVEMMIGNGKVT